MILLVTGKPGHGQNALLENDFRNDVRQPSHAGVTPSEADFPPPPEPLGNPGLRMNVSTYGGWKTRRSLIFVPIAVGNTVVNWPVIAAGAIPTDTGPLAPGQFVYPGNGTIQLRSAVIGRHLMGRRATYGIGDVIEPPLVRLDGTPTPPGYFLPEPAHTPAHDPPEFHPVTSDPLPQKLNPVGGDQFYWSPHAQKVFATQPGNIVIKWRIANTNPVQTEEHTYVVSFASKVPVRKVYWTENGFNAPRVAITKNRISAVNIVYNSYFPKTVGEDEVYPARRGQTLVSKADSVRTLWENSAGMQDGLLQAYNREGRVFVEFLGSLVGEGDSERRIHLGFEVIDVARETAPLAKKMIIGDKVAPVDEPDLDESTLQASLHTELGASVPFFHRQAAPAGMIDLYAIRTTTPTFINGMEYPSNEAVAYWMQPGNFDILWPRQYASYIIEWPSPAQEEMYSLYARPSSADPATAQATSVALPGDNLPLLAFQDDPLRQHAVLGVDRRFYTIGNGWSLIHHQQGNEVWFERVLSRKNDEFATYTEWRSATVGERLTPPPGAPDLPGHILPESGRAYHAGAYIDPLVAGFEEAGRGSIIGVNALTGESAPDTGKNTLEVWWFRSNQPPDDSGIKPTYWPAYVNRYTLSWPADAPEIVMASNLGSGDLPSLQATGSIYTQNNKALPGYNPNEEHALLLGGTAWALRDDLNGPNSSEPYVLVDYLEADQRPAMSVFRVLREKDPWFFDYPATAGTVLQAPMPLPLLPLPLDGAGKVIHREVDADSDPPANELEEENEAYALFTMKDRNGTTWIHRGPHDEENSPSFQMQFFYRMRPGFYFPDREAPAQPPAGTNLPYLRPYANPDDVAAGYVGDAVTGNPLSIVFNPVWPANVPELRLGQTLTLAAAGLPQVRGNTSLEVVYQQSIALQEAPDDEDDYEPLKSAVLFDPTRAKTYEFSAAGLAAIPDSVKTSNYQGKTYFPNLPPHLSRRLYMDPNVGPSGALVFIGEFKDEIVGDDYLLPNVLSPAEVALVKDLCNSSDTDRSRWNTAIDGLRATREQFVEDSARPGTYTVDDTVRFSATEPVEITDDDQAVDSYALSATGGGTGYIVLLAGGGEAFTPSGEPVALHIIRVPGPLYRGGLKGIAPSNPLDEQFTLQYSGDFAGHPQEYEFEWRYGRPVVGLPPELYSLTPHLTMGDGSWTLINHPPGNPAPLRAPGPDLSTLSPVTLPANGPFAIRDNTEAASTEGSPPLAVLRREFVYLPPAESSLSRLFLSLSISGSAEVDAPVGLTAWLNGEPVVTWNVRGEDDSLLTGPPGGTFTPLPLVFSLPTTVLRSGVNVITLELHTTDEAGSLAQVNARFEAEHLELDLDGWDSLGAGPGEAITPQGGIAGKNRHTLGGPGLLTLTDNYFIVRYRAVSEDHAAYDEDGGWSTWTEPQLVEGWIKRVLAGINPFQQRITDLYNNAVNTEVSLVSQAGRRWEGDIALNLENVNAAGLIEIYETVLRRGKMLSIEGTPPLSDAGANDALLLAAGYLNDLYLILHNEAYADAADSTIAFGTDGGDYGSVVTSLFAFRGQMASVLEEELALLRGRDDFLQPGTRTAPYYNRLVWNYTRGIDAGEAIYALNYNIKDRDLDGLVGPADAAQAYPQGHGDAYGHALTALTGYYGLLRNTHFSWTPRIEAVTVLGRAVSVDYQDERKFAAAAAALARATSQTVDLTYRQQYTPSDTPSWANLKDGRHNSATAITRRWGTDDWASRGGQGAYFHWITANSFLPHEDPDPSHEGIQKIDRTTVPELTELAAQAAAIQTSQDTADARLNPLGLSHSALPFDIDPNFLDVGSTVQGKMYFPQILERSLKALQNAAGAFQRAGTVTEFLRRQGDSLDDQRAAIYEQERAFEAALVDIYGTPYSDDIGPGRTWAQGYEGPDLIHYAYVDQVEKLTAAPDEETTKITFRTTTAFNDETSNLDFKPELADPDEMLTITVNERGEMVKPEEWTGRRAHPGRLQTAYSDWMTARRELLEAAEDVQYATLVIDRQLKLYASAADAGGKAVKLERDNTTLYGTLTPVRMALESVSRYLEMSVDLHDSLKDIIDDGTPSVIGAATDSFFPVRFIATLLNSMAQNGIRGSINALTFATSGIEHTIEMTERLNALATSESAWKHENLQLLHDLRMAVEDSVTQQRDLDGALRRFDQAERDLLTLQSEGLRIRKEREVFRQRAAAIIHGYRTKDFAFRAFRSEALESYKLLFDNAARATFLAARAYDYETGLLDTDRSPAAAEFFNAIVKARALGVVDESGNPQFGGSSSGDPGLAGLLARLQADWSVVESRLGFNNPDRYRTTFSLRTENFRILNGAEGDGAWRTVLDSARMSNILEDPDVLRYCLQAGDPGGLAVPGFVIPFSSTIQPGRNFFGHSLAGGDSAFSPSSFATKIRANGIAFQGYIGIASPSSASGATSGAGGQSPADPWTGFTDPNALSATPYVYLIPAGQDFMRAPALGDAGAIRSWQVEDQAMPLPFNIGQTPNNTLNTWQGALALTESPFILRKHQAFRAIPDSVPFSDGIGFTNTRLIGRSVWNSQWKLVIPGNTLLGDASKGTRIFADTVKDIKLHFETYSYSGN